MLIGIDASRALRARRTGTENYSLQLIRHLLALPSDHRFRLYCGAEPAPGLFAPAAGQPGRPAPAHPATEPGSRPAASRSADGPMPERCELRVLPCRRLWTHLCLSMEMVRHPPDVLFVPAHVLPLVHPRRSVVTVHDLGYRYFPQAHGRRARWYLELSTRFNVRTAAHVLADSQATKEDLVRGYGVDPQRVSVVYLGRDEALAPVEDPRQLAAVRERLGIGADVPYVLYVGTLQPRKNLVRLIEAFARVRHSLAQRQPGLRLVLAGQAGWLAEGIFRRVVTLDLQEHVLFPGFVDDDDLPALLSGAVAFAFPSLYEGFGLPVLEAQACGTPVLAANSSSLPEVAGDAALLVDPLDVLAIADGLERLLTDTALRERLRVAGFANICRFSWRRCAQETLAILECCDGGR